MPGPRGPLTLTHCADSTPVLPPREINSQVGPKCHCSCPFNRKAQGDEHEEKKTVNTARDSSSLKIFMVTPVRSLVSLRNHTAKDTILANLRTR